MLLLDTYTGSMFMSSVARLARAAASANLLERVGPRPEIVVPYVLPRRRPSFRLDGFTLDPPPPTVRVAAKVGRNDPCPCGSGRKSKKCCHP